MWSSKALGLLIVTAFATSLATERPTPLVAAAVWLAIVNELEGFAASALLPAWHADVPTLMHALRLSLDGK